MHNHKRSIEAKRRREERQKLRLIIKEHSIHEPLEKETLSDADFFAVAPSGKWEGKPINLQMGEVFYNLWNEGTLQDKGVEPPLWIRIASV